MTVGERIKQARKEVGLTQKELGTKLGISFQTVAQWETGRRNPKYETLKKIADALGYPTDFFFTSESNNIGEKIITQRKSIGIDEFELADRSGFEVKQIYAFEDGRLTPTLGERERLCNALECDIHYLMNDFERAATDEMGPVCHFNEELPWDVPEDKNSAPPSEGDKVAADIINRLSQSKESWKKIPPEDFIQTFASLQFQSEDDRIAYYYSKLNDAGRTEATRCFFKHLDEQSKKDVADYVQGLTQDARYTSDTGALLSPDTTPHE